MKISEILKEKRTLSFEVFPPKLDMPMEPLMDSMDHLQKYNPDFVSVTYGAGGTNKGRNDELCANIIERRLTLVSHFTCIGNTKKDVHSRLENYENIGAENILALRGDLPEGWEGTRGDYDHADELIETIANDFPNLCIGGACYPEKHIEAESFKSDIKYLKQKQTNGAQFFVSQLCFDVEAFDRFLDMARKNGVSAPIIVGIMPALNVNGILRMTSSNGCVLSHELQKIIEKYKDNSDDFKKAGKEYTVSLIENYSKLDIAGIHIYTLNKYKDVSDIVDNLSSAVYNG